MAHIVNQRVPYIIAWIILFTLLAPISNAQSTPPPFDPATASRTVAEQLNVPSGNVSTSDLTMRTDWVFGMSVLRAPTDDHGEPWLVLFLARYIDGEWVITLESEPTFTDWLAMAPAGLLPGDSASRLLQIRREMAQPSARADGSSLLSLPYAAGETWTLTGGPHDCCGGDTTNAGAVDFADGLTDGNIRAAREGVVWRSANCGNFIRVDHPDGWQTGYYHVINERVNNGQSVARGQYIADQGNGVGCGGSSTGPHLHFSLRFDGVPYSLHNHDVGGWTVLAGAAEYEGCMRRIRDGLLQCARGPIYNDGAIGSGDGTPLAPEDTDLMTNGDFSGDFVGWETAFSTTTAINQEVLAWYGAPGDLPGTVHQVVNYTAPVGTVIELQLDLGNSSPAEKRIRAHVQSYADGEGVWDSGLLVCEFILPAGDDLRTYILRREIETTWPQMRVWIEGYPGDGEAAILTDNVQLRRLSASDTTTTECIDIPPNVPGPITRLNPADGSTVSDFANGIDFQWEAREDTVWYHIYITGPDNFVLDTWLEGFEICVDDVCTLPESPTLNNGDYDWWMAGWNADGIGEYTQTTFDVRVNIPGLIQRDAPTDFYPLESLSWAADPVATWYHVYLAKDGVQLVNQWHLAADVCSDDLCTASTPLLTNADYDWWMAGWGPGGFGEYDNVTFTLDEPLPSTITMLSPAGSVPAGNLSLVWEADPLALWYHVYLVIPDDDDADIWFYRDDVCAEGTCSAPFTLNGGEITWWSAGWGPGGMGAYTSRQLSVNTP